MVDASIVYLGISLAAAKPARLLGYGWHHGRGRIGAFDNARDAAFTTGEIANDGR